MTIDELRALEAGEARQRIKAAAAVLRKTGKAPQMRLAEELENADPVMADRVVRQAIADHLVRKAMERQCACGQQVRRTQEKCGDCVATLRKKLDTAPLDQRAAEAKPEEEYGDVGPWTERDVEYEL
jgi:hypothetical protein